MKNKILLPILFLGLVLGLPVSAAPGDLDVQFEQTPLFSNSNFLPGDSVTKYIQVTNNGSEAHDIYIKPINISDNDDLGDVLNLVIKEGATELYNNTLAQFFDDALVFLSNLNTSANTQYDLSVTFQPGAGDDYQGSTVEFDFIIGFDDSTEPPDGGPLGTNGGGGGGGCADCVFVTPTPTPTPGIGVGGGIPDPTPTPTPIVRGSSTDNPDFGSGLTIGGDLPEDNTSKSFPDEKDHNTNVLFASIFGFLSCSIWLIILLILLIILTLLDRGYPDMRKIFMLLILGIVLALTLLGYIPCDLWIFLLVLLAIIYLLFRRYVK